MGPTRAEAGAFTAGALCVNSLPHLATAATGHRHLTPLGGRDSSPGVNAAWGTINLVAGLALLRRAAPDPGRWDSRLVAFELGSAVFAAWMFGSEAVAKMNSRHR
ncbi:hypothetical protein [Arthrobacter sp. JSM 101049]|uniref:hypothetical protein n=1 Tax=Arthrobacter sp. JSM 101049 TaxID=929097 RepID=UPI00356AC399